MHWQCKYRVGMMRLLPIPLPQTARQGQHSAPRALFNHPGISKRPPKALFARTGLHCHVGVHLQHHIFVFIKE